MGIKAKNILVRLYQFGAFQNKMTTSCIHSVRCVLYVSVIDTSDFTVYSKALSVYSKAFKVALGTL